MLCRHIECACALCGPHLLHCLALQTKEEQVWEDREEQASSSTAGTPTHTQQQANQNVQWVRRVVLLRDDINSVPWSLADGSGAELSVEDGMKVAGSILVQSSNRM